MTTLLVLAGIVITLCIIHAVMLTLMVDNVMKELIEVRARIASIKEDIHTLRITLPEQPGPYVGGFEDKSLT